MWEKEKEERERDLKNHKEEIRSLNNRLADNLRNSMDPNKPRIDNFH
jgi:tetrahydromethanopterin S-methyltransferase subunit B